MIELISYLPLVTVLIATGLVAGTLAGLLGVGGGIVIVPVLYHLMTTWGADSELIHLDPALQMHMAVGTSLATIIPTSIASSRAHHRRGALDLGLLRMLGPGVFAGALIGGALAGPLRGGALTGIFAAVALIVAFHMAFTSDRFRLSDSLPANPARGLLAVIIGGLSSLMGIGGGTLSVPFLTAFAVPIHRAVGTAAAIGLLIALPGAAGFAIAGWDMPGRPVGSLGYINLIAVALIVPATVIASPWGAALAHYLSRVWLRRAFALFLGLTAVRMIAGLLA